LAEAQDSALDDARPIGWFVGWAENDGRKIAFARVRTDSKSDRAFRAGTARHFLKELPALMRGQ
jgi:beta-lactamase class D